MKKSIVLIGVCIVILGLFILVPMVGKKNVKAQQLSVTSNPTASSAPTLTASPLPTESPTETPIPTVAASATPTQETVKFSYVGSSAQWNTSSSFLLDASQAAGEYYAIGNSSTGAATRYTCTFGTDMPKRLTCKGGAMPFNQSVYIDLYDAATGEILYSNTITFAGIVPTPTGMSCEAEPQWNGFIADHQLDQGCFAITCFQNGSFYYGNDYVCQGDWPFEWNLPSPLYTPQAKLCFLPQRSRAEYSLNPAFF